MALLEGLSSISTMAGRVRVPAERSPPTGLPSCSSVPQKVEDVIDDLERHADGASVLAQRLDGVGVAVGHHGAAGAGGREERRRLAVNAAVVVAHRARVGVEGGDVLRELALGHHHQRVGEESDDADVAGARDQLGGVREHVVAEHDGGRIAECRVGRHVPAPRVGGINHIVVDERRGVQQLNRGGQRNLLVGVIVAKAAAEQRDRGSKALPTAREHLIEHRLERHEVRSGDKRERVLNNGKVVRDGLVKRGQGGHWG